MDPGVIQGSLMELSVAAAVWCKAGHLSLRMSADPGKAVPRPVTSAEYRADSTAVVCTEVDRKVCIERTLVMYCA